MDEDALKPAIKDVPTRGQLAVNYLEAVGLSKLHLS